MSTHKMVFVTTVLALTFTIAETKGYQLCGQNLADMLDLVCYGRGFHSIPRERGVPHITKRTAMQYTTAQQANGGGTAASDIGVVAECCWKACSLSDMESYCAAPIGTTFPNPTNGPISRALAASLLSGARGHSETTISPTTTTTAPTTPAPAVTSVRPHFRFPTIPLSGSRYNIGTKFFFVRHVGPAPTRTPTVA